MFLEHAHDTPPRDNRGDARQAALLVFAVVLLALLPPHTLGAQVAVPTLAATVHPPLPADTAGYWLVPDAAAGRSVPGARRLADGVRHITAGRFAEALPLVDGAGLDGSPLAAYARHYRGVALMGLLRHEEAVAALQGASATGAAGALQELAALRLVEAALAVGQADAAARALAAVGETRLQPEDVLLQLARTEEAAGRIDSALDAYRQLYFDFPASTQAVAAAEVLARMPDGPFAATDAPRALARAERLFAAGRWAEARDAFVAVAPLLRGADRDENALRIAQCDHHLGRHQAARDALQPLLDRPDVGDEARYFHLTSTRALGQHATYVTLVRRLVADRPDSDWSAEALNGLASHYITTDDEAQADSVFRELARRFPEHRHAERAAWRIGWRAYKQGRFSETASLFERAAAMFPRSDHRPQWLYWSGRARDRMDDRALANERYRLAVADYQNLYHGRLAARLLEARREPPVAPTVTVARPVSARLPTDTLIRELAAAQLHDAALREVQYARQRWGDSPQLQATAAWLLHQQGQGLTATERFTALRGAITTMRRAYPQFMAAGGEALPAPVRRIIFPLDYWPLIDKYATAHGLDPYLMAALMAQESTFTPEIRSSANAIGLMQIIPATGQRYAARLGIRNFTSAMLTQPETNVRIGMRYFKDLVDRFGAPYFALAGYNAGEGRVARWIQERPGMAQDEFIDDIPFAETQNYVKRILGTAEDYRRLYGPDAPEQDAAAAVASAR